MGGFLWGGFGGEFLWVGFCRWGFVGGFCGCFVGGFVVVLWVGHLRYFDGFRHACACAFPEMGRWGIMFKFDQVGSNPISGCRAPESPVLLLSSPSLLLPPFFLSLLPLLLSFLLFSSPRSLLLLSSPSSPGAKKKPPAGAGSGAEPQFSNVSTESTAEGKKDLKDETKGKVR